MWKGRCCQPYCNNSAAAQHIEGLGLATTGKKIFAPKHGHNKHNKSLARPPLTQKPPRLRRRCVPQLTQPYSLLYTTFTQPPH